MGCTSIINNLPGEEEVFVVHGEGFSWLNILGPLEEEDEAIDFRFKFGNEFVIVHAVDFLDLDGRHSEFGHKLSKNTRI